MVGDFPFWRRNKKVHFLANKRSKGKSTFCGCTSHSEEDIQLQSAMRTECFFGWDFSEMAPYQVYVDESGGGSERWTKWTSDLSCLKTWTGFLWVIISNLLFFFDSCLYSYFTCVLWKGKHFYTRGTSKCQVSVALCNCSFRSLTVVILWYWSWDPLRQRGEFDKKKATVDSCWFMILHLIIDRS